MTDKSQQTPERLGAYVLERRLGAGGMGVVHLARTVAGRQLAVKVIRREYSEDPGFRARFRREVAAARQVSGAFTAPVVDADPEGDPPWLATLYVPGGSLTDHVDRRGPMTAREAAGVGAQLAEALQDIHRCSLVHRDLKPGNVLLAEDGVRVIDFGISRALTDSHRLTENGTVLGSPPFMAPEQLTGDAEVTAAADVFALGAVVAFATTGYSPFEGGRPGGDPLAVAYRVVHEEPDLSAVPESLRDMVALCLAKDPERRPEVATVLRMAAWADTRAQAATVRDSPVWQGTLPRDHDARAGDQDTPAVGSPGHRRRRASRGLAALVAAVAVIGAAGFWGWATWPERTMERTGPHTPVGTDPTAPPPQTAEAFKPWEVDLQSLGVRDAITEEFHCQAADADLLCTSGARSAVLLDEYGTERWRHSGPRDTVIGGSAMYARGTVFAASPKGVVALKATDGAVRWEIDAPELAGPLVLTEDSLVLRNGDSTLRFYDLDSPTPRGGWDSPGRYITALRGNGSQVLVETRSDGDPEGVGAGADPELTLLDGSDGSSRWLTPEPHPDTTEGQLELIGMDQEAAYFQERDLDLPVYTAVSRLDLTDRTWCRRPSNGSARWRRASSTRPPATAGSSPCAPGRTRRGGARRPEPA